MTKFKCLSFVRLLSELSGLSDERKYAVVLKSPQKDSTGKYAVNKLIGCLRNIQGEATFVVGADKAVENLPTLVNEPEFASLVKRLAAILGCSLGDITKRVVTEVLLADGFQTISSHARNRRSDK